MSLIRCQASRWGLALILASAAACAPETRVPADDPVLPGIDVLVRDSLHLVSGRRVGLITNRAGVTREGRSTIDVLWEHPDVELVALFAPEHGIRGTVAEGRAIGDEVDEATGLTVHSLYGGSREPTPAMLDAIDVLLFDLQDIGARYYTYVSTMAVSMRAAGEAGVPFIVLDRPNPIAGPVNGPVLDPAFSTFVGLFPVPSRHGMTAGELARLYVGEFGIRVDLTVVPAAGWRRDMWFDETGLPWVAPSLNMPTLESAAHYPGTCLFEGTNLSVGRGTPHAFQQIGAPWLSGPDLAAALEAHELIGVSIEPVDFTPSSPSDGKHAGTAVSGVRLTVTDRLAYDPVRTALALLVETRAASGDRWEWIIASFDRLAGTDEIRLAVEAAARSGIDERVIAARAIADSWSAGLASFERLRAPYLIY
jgi:uncharacterized protein YbbC (DUF1343 family)